MTREDKIKVLAELDGWQFYGIERTQILWTLKNPQGETVACEEDPGTTFASFAHLVPDYLTSYDAIIPLIQKQDGEMRMLVCDYCLKTLGFGCYFDALPEQLADALIKAVGKWRE